MTTAKNRPCTLPMGRALGAFATVSSTVMLGMSLKARSRNTGL